MDVIDLVKNDHRQITRLFDEISNTDEADGAKRESLFSELRNWLESHIYGEEKTIYDRIESEDEMHDLLLGSYEDHQLVVETLQALQELDVNEEDWRIKFDALHDDVVDHLEQEEAELLPLLPDFFSDDERDQMSEDMVSYKEEMMASDTDLKQIHYSHDELQTNT